MRSRRGVFFAQPQKSFAKKGIKFSEWAAVKPERLDVENLG